MEEPLSFRANDVRIEKEKVLSALTLPGALFLAALLHLEAALLVSLCFILCVAALILDGNRRIVLDLSLRGPGEFFGTKQSGLPALRIANVLRDSEILEIARREAATLLDRPETDDDRSRALEYLQGHWQTRYGLAQVG